MIVKSSKSLILFTYFCLFIYLTIAALLITSKSNKYMISEYNSESTKLNRSRPVLKEGEWACADPKCAFVNGEKRYTCQKCGKAKPRAKQRVGKEIGKEAAEKSKGLFAAEDWVCSKCGNVNWARRHMCNICNAPKMADLEVRTGYGGGYMDREDVEYIERDEDDEEFDEFGRKKKKRNEGVQQKKGDDESTEDFGNEKKEKTGNEDEEEDEIEEEDEADLEKYDLTADAELASFKVNLEILRKKLEEEGGKSGNKEKREGNIGAPRSIDGSSDCSCSCSGGECSCMESEDEEIQRKKQKKEAEEENEKGRKKHWREENERNKQRMDKVDRGRSRGEEYRNHRGKEERGEHRGEGGEHRGRDERRRSRDRDK